MKEKSTVEFLKELETLLRQTRACQNIELTYGSLTYEPAKDWNDGVVVQNAVGKLYKQVFTPSKKDITDYDFVSAYVRIKLGNKIMYQCVEGSSNWGIVLDVINRLKEEHI